MSTIAVDHRETLRATDEYRIQRLGRFLVAELAQPSSVLSTSFINGGQSRNVRYLVNHQSCEAVAHDPPAGKSRADVPRAIVLTCATGLLSLGICLLALTAVWR